MQRQSQLGLNINRIEVGEPWQVPRIWLECSKLEFKQETTVEGRMRITIADNVEIQVNNGDRLTPLWQVMSTWSLNKLKDVIRHLDKIRRNTYVDPENAKKHGSTFDTDAHMPGEEEVESDPNWEVPRFDFGMVVDKDELVD